MNLGGKYKGSINDYMFKITCNNKNSGSGTVAHAVILATQETEIGRKI
jgi:hypothetical protein